MVVLVYADDIVIASNDSHASKTFKTYLDDCFSSKDLRPLTYFLRIEVARGPDGVFFFFGAENFKK